MPGVGSRFTASYCASPPAGLKIPAPGDALSQNTEEGWSVFPPARVGVCCLERPHQGRGHGSILNPQPHGWDLLMAGKSGGRHRESGTAPSPPAAGWRCWGGGIQHRTPSLPCMPGQMLITPARLDHCIGASAASGRGETEAGCGDQAQQAAERRHRSLGSTPQTTQIISQTGG